MRNCKTVLGLCERKKGPWSPGIRKGLVPSLPGLFSDWSSLALVHSRAVRPPAGPGSHTGSGRRVQILDHCAHGLSGTRFSKVKIQMTWPGERDMFPQSAC